MTEMEFNNISRFCVPRISYVVPNAIYWKRYVTHLEDPTETQVNAAKQCNLMYGTLGNFIEYKVNGVISTSRVQYTTPASSEVYLAGRGVLYATADNGAYSESYDVLNNVSSAVKACIPDAFLCTTNYEYSQGLVCDRVVADSPMVNDDSMPFGISTNNSVVTVNLGNFGKTILKGVSRYGYRPNLTPIQIGFVQHEKTTSFHEEWKKGFN